MTSLYRMVGRRVPPTGRSHASLLVAWLALACLTPTVRGEGFALIVGVNACPNFELPDGSRPRPLKGAEHDAEALAAVLIEGFAFPCENVVLLRGEEARLACVRAKFNELQSQMRKDDSFVFHFSGHGTRVADRRPYDEADGLDEALCTYDATNDGENLLLDDELGRWLDMAAVKNVTAILDCCHAGTGTKQVDADEMPRYLPLAAASVKRTAAENTWRDLQTASKSFDRRTTALFACRPEQQAYERRISIGGKTMHAGQFSHYLLEGLRERAADANGDGLVTSEEAAAYAARRINETFNRRRDNSADRQEPLVESDAANAPLFRK